MTVIKNTALFTVVLVSILISSQVQAEDASILRPDSPLRIDTDRIKGQRLEEARIKIASKEASLKRRLATFRNKQKAQVAERINNNLSRINEKITLAMQRHLEVMTNILNKLEKRVNEGAPDIKNPALAREAIAEAKEAIRVASEAVSAQAEKAYVLETTSEATIRTDLQKVKEQLQTDLKELRQLLITTKQAVARAIRVAKSGQTEEATNSGQQ